MLITCVGENWVEVRNGKITNTIVLTGGKIPESYNPEFVGVIDDAFGVYSIEMKK